MREHVRSRHALAAVVAGIVAVVTLLLAPVAGSAEPGAEVELSKARVYLGEQIRVVGTGFESRDTVAIKFCGAPDASGRLACNKGLQGVRATAAGRVSEDIKVTEPAGPCPCRVVIDSEDSPPVGASINLVGYPVAKKVKVPQIVVDEATVSKAPGIGHLFGLAPEPTLTLKLRNAGASPAQPTVDLAWRDGDHEPVAITDSGVPVIEPGESVEFALPLTFGVLAQGEHVVEGQIVVGDLVTPVEASTTVGPWGLYVLAALALVGGAVLLVRTSGAAPARTSRSGSRSHPSRSGSSRPSSSRTVPAPRRTPSRSHRAEPEYVGPPRLESTPITPLVPPSSAVPTSTPTAATPARPAVPVGAVEPESPLGRLKAAVHRPSTLVDEAPAPVVPRQQGASPTPVQQWSAPEVTPEVPSRSSTPEQDKARVAEALAAIKERNTDSPARLPDNEPAPPVGRRAERGGKRAARPERGPKWIPRR